jgi:hypothetical protein
MTNGADAGETFEANDQVAAVCIVRSAGAIEQVKQ